MELPEEIFDLCKTIPNKKPIYESTKDRWYLFGGIRTKRNGNKCIFYIIPTKTENRNTNEKTIEESDIDGLWTFLMVNKIIKTKDFIIQFKHLYKDGGCCVGAFYGIINCLFPNTFIKG